MELLLSVAAIHLLACLSPGPDILLVVLNSLRHGWRTGVATTCGILIGGTIQISLGIRGITYLLSRSPNMQSITALAGGSWLFYLGMKGLIQRTPSPSQSNSSLDSLQDGAIAAVGQGFLVNILNPKALLYFLSLFSVLLGVNVSLDMKIAAGITMIAVQAIAFSTVAFLLDHLKAGTKWKRMQGWLERGISGILIILGLSIWLRSILSLMS